MGIVIRARIAYVGARRAVPKTIRAQHAVPLRVKLNQIQLAWIPVFAGMTTLVSASYRALIAKTEPPVRAANLPLE